MYNNKYYKCGLNSSLNNPKRLNLYSICFHGIFMFRYKVTPAGEINFGPLVYGSRSSQSFTIDNTGEFEGRFTIGRMSNGLQPVPPWRQA